MLLCQRAKDLRREQPAQLACSGLRGVVELDADGTALLYLHVGAPGVAGEQVHGQLVQPRPVPGECYGLLPRVGFQREDDFLGRDVGLQGRELLRCGPASLFGKYLSGPPRPFVGAAQESLYIRDDATETTGRPPELLLAFRRERTPAIVGPAFRVAAVGDSVANEVEVHASLPNVLARWFGHVPVFACFVHDLLEALPSLAFRQGAEGFRTRHAGAKVRRLAGAAFRVDAHREGGPARYSRTIGFCAELPQVSGGDDGILMVAEVVLQRFQGLDQLLHTFAVDLGHELQGVSQPLPLLAHVVESLGG